MLFQSLADFDKFCNRHLNEASVGYNDGHKNRTAKGLRDLVCHGPYRFPLAFVWVIRLTLLDMSRTQRVNFLYLVEFFCDWGGCALMTWNWIIPLRGTLRHFTVSPVAKLYTTLRLFKFSWKNHVDTKLTRNFPIRLRLTLSVSFKLFHDTLQQYISPFFFIFPNFLRQLSPVALFRTRSSYTWGSSIRTIGWWVIGKQP